MDEEAGRQVSRGKREGGKGLGEKEAGASISVNKQWQPQKGVPGDMSAKGK